MHPETQSYRPRVVRSLVVDYIHCVSHKFGRMLYLPCTTDRRYCQREFARWPKKKTWSKLNEFYWTIITYIVFFLSIFSMAGVLQENRHVDSRGASRNPWRCVDIRHFPTHCHILIVIYNGKHMFLMSYWFQAHWTFQGHRAGRLVFNWKQLLQKAVSRSILLLLATKLYYGAFPTHAFYLILINHGNFKSSISCWKGYWAWW